MKQTLFKAATRKQSIQNTVLEIQVC